MTDEICEPCLYSSAIGIALKICYEHGDKKECKAIYTKLLKNEIKTVDEFLEAIRKAVKEEAKEMVDEIKKMVKEAKTDASED
jgi:predicted DNA-binding ArsR family transcriptional regulator